WMRLWTSAEMKTVLPARERPVTPSRIVGPPRSPIRSASVAKAMRASSATLVSGRLLEAGRESFDWGTAIVVPAASAVEAGRAFSANDLQVAGTKEGNDAAGPRAHLIPAGAVEIDHREARRGKSVGDLVP